MRLAGVLTLLFVIAVFGEDEEELPLAVPCDVEACVLPDCRCSSTNIPGGLAARDTPQFVTITFDDGVNINNIATYREILYDRVNKNGCPASATFYVNHEYTNYQLVNELYNRGFEIALHSITHQTPQSYWADASYEDMVKEFAEQRIQMAHFANIPLEAIKGVRIPFLQMAGNASFQMMADYGLKYDCSWSTVTQTNPPLWPYTLDYASTQDCTAPPCPTASIPGPWVQPMVSWTDLMGFPCAMVDACFAFPDRNNEEEWFKFILTNFERHYLTNRAPFGFYVHEWYVSAYPAVKRALVRFMDLVNNLNDAFMVSSDEVIDWIRHPIPVPEFKEELCRAFIPTTCSAATCGPLVAEHSGLEYFLQICNVCPNTYPWLGNPLGL